MRGNLSTDGLYDSTKKFGILPQTTATLNGRVHQLPPAPHSSHVQAASTSEARSKLPLASGSTKSQRAAHVRKRDGIRKPKPPPDHQPSASALSARFQSALVNTASSTKCRSALWIRPEGIGDGGPVITHYDESCPYSLISKTAALNLGLKIIPCRPRLQLSIMTQFGMVNPKEYASLHVEAPWMEDRDLGKRDVAVADDILESRGIEFLAGKRILQKKVSRPAQNCQSGSRSYQQSRQEDVVSSFSDNSAWMLHGGTAGGHSQFGSDLRQPAMETFSRITQSNSISGFQSLSCQSTNGLRPESTVLTSSFGSVPNQSPAVEAAGYNWNASPFNNRHGSLNVEESALASFAYLNPLISVAEVEINPSSAGFVPNNAASQQSCITPQPTLAIGSPEVSVLGTDYSSPHTNHMYLSVETQVEYPISQTQENFISEDSSAMYQGMTDWSLLPTINVESPALDNLPISDSTMFPKDL